MKRGVAPWSRRGGLFLLLLAFPFLIFGLGFFPSAPLKLPPPPAGGQKVWVKRVIDGDTIVLANGQRVRYLGINAPEDTGHHHDCFGHQATLYNRQLVLHRTVILAADKRTVDKYGRWLRYLWVDGQFVNGLMLRNGYAQVEFLGADGRYFHLFNHLEAEAQRHHRGLWRACFR